MDNEQARFVLAAAQPSGRDADRPEVAEALSHAHRDPELAAWLARERRSDLALTRKLRELEPPAGLRAQILAGSRASRRRAHFRHVWRISLAWAAAAMLAIAGSWAYLRLDPPDTTLVREASGPDLAEWQRDAVAIFSDPRFRLDVENADYAPLQDFLLTHGGPVAGRLPFSPAIASAAGCKILDWRGTTVSLACFFSDTGELVHLFVRPSDGLDTASLPHEARRGRIDGFSTVTWVRGDRIIMVASRLPAGDLERMLDPARIAHLHRRPPAEAS